jgi:hypothetical protein
MSLKKQWSRTLLAENDDAHTFEDDDVGALTALAHGALRQLTTLLGDGAGAVEERRELRRLSKALRQVEPLVRQRVADAALAAPTAPESTLAEHGAAARGASADAADPAAAVVVDLGQYSTAQAFDADERKRLRFARLMGAAKKQPRVEGDGGDDSGADAIGHPAAQHHTTFALSERAQRQVESELEREFDAARTHRGKKGLGAK